MSSSTQNEAVVVKLGNLSVTRSELDGSRKPTAGVAEAPLRAAEVAVSMFHAPGTDKKPGAAMSGWLSFTGITGGLIVGNELAKGFKKSVGFDEYSESTTQRLKAVISRAIPPILAAIGGISFSNFFYKERENADLAAPKNVLGLVEKMTNLYGQAVTKVSAFANTQGASGGIRLLGFNGWFNSAMFSLRQFVTVAFPGLNQLLSGVHDNEATGPLTIMKRLTAYCSESENPSFEKIKYYCDGVLSRISSEDLSREDILRRADKMAVEFYSVVQSFRAADGTTDKSKLKAFLASEYSEEKIDSLIFGTEMDKIEGNLKPGDAGYNHRLTFGGLGFTADKITKEPKGWIGKTAKPLVIESDLKAELKEVEKKIAKSANTVAETFAKLQIESLQTNSMSV